MTEPIPAEHWRTVRRLCDSGDGWAGRPDVAACVYPWCKCPGMAALEQAKAMMAPSEHGNRPSDDPERARNIEEVDKWVASLWPESDTADDPERKEA